jgi:hypothetical protein
VILVDVVDGRERVARVDVVLPEPDGDRQRRDGAEQRRVRDLPAAGVDERPAQRQVEPSVVADEAGAGEKERGSDRSTRPEQEQASEHQRAERRLARRGRARLDVERREGEDHRRGERGLASRETAREPVQQDDRDQAAGERKEFRRPVSRRPRRERRGDERKVSRPELERLGEAAPEVRRREPPLGKLDADRRVAVVLDSDQERRQASSGPAEQGEKLEAALPHRALSTRLTDGGKPATEWRDSQDEAIQKCTGPPRSARRGRVVP